MTNMLGHRAIVIGGSMTGLMTARVLADYFDEVTVLERDAIEDGPVIHRSVPQGNHYHALLLGGQRVMSSLYPGFVEKLKQLGSTSCRVGEEVVWYLPNGKSYSPSGLIPESYYLGFDCYSQSRGLIEHCVRRCTLALSNIKIETGSLVQGLVCENGRVRGVSYESSGGPATLASDLVVDAGGRGSRAPRWLTEMGYQQPDETSIGVDFAYSSTKFRIPDWYDEGERLLIFFGPAPMCPNGGIMGQIQDNTWHVSLAGRFGDYPPDDEDGFLAFAKSIYTPKLYSLIKDAERVDDIKHYRYPTSLLRHYERLTSFPEGFVVLGDAISSFNPVYGQGMSSAAQQVDALRGLLAARAAESQGLAGLAQAFFPIAAEVVATPWALAAGQDLAYPQTTGVRPPNMAENGQYFATLGRLAQDDMEVFRIMTEVFQLARPMSDLMAEPLRSRVLAQRPH